MKTSILLVLVAVTYSVARESISLPTTDWDKLTCSNTSCNQSCASSERTGGYCKGDSCWCWRYGQPENYIRRPLALIKKTTQTNDSSEDVPTCAFDSCFNNCHENGLGGGHCRFGICVCIKLPLNSIPLHGTVFHNGSILSDMKDNSTDALPQEQCSLECEEQGWIVGISLTKICWCSRNERTDERFLNQIPNAREPSSNQTIHQTEHVDGVTER